MITSQGWLLVNRYPEETKKYEEYTTIITKEKIQLALLKLNELDFKILNLIKSLKIVTSIQLTRFIYKEEIGIKKNAIVYTNRRLKKLYELGCIDRFFPLVENTKGLDYVHVVLGPVGSKILKLEKFRRVKSLNQNWRHTVMVNEILSNLSVKFSVTKWKKELKLEWKSGDTKLHNQQPDLFITYTNKKQEKYAFIEADMGTEMLQTLVNKSKKYIEYFNTIDFKRADWQPYKKDNIAILPEVWFIMKYKKDAISLKTKLSKINSNVIFKVVLLDDIKVSI